MRKVPADLHQGWASPESLATRPGLKLHTVKVPARWLERAVCVVQLLEQVFGPPTRFLAVAGLVEVLFRGGVFVSLPCPRVDSNAFREALKEALR